MQKLNTGIFDKIQSKKVKGKALDLLMYISRYQNEFGVLNLCSRTVRMDLGFNKQTFYTALNELEDSGIATVDITHTWGYYRVTLIDNIFNFNEKDEFKKKPYISTNNHNFVFTREFRILTGACKRFILGVLRRMGQYRKKRITMKSFKQFAGVISERSIWSFIKATKMWFDIKKDGNAYIVSIKRNTYNKYDSQSEQQKSIWYKVREFVDKYKIKHTDWQVNNTVDLFIKNGYQEKHGGIFINTLIDVCLNKGRLIPKLINKTLQFKLNKNNIEENTPSNNSDAQLDNVESTKSIVDPYVAERDEYLEIILSDDELEGLLV